MCKCLSGWRVKYSNNQAIKQSSNIISIFNFHSNNQAIRQSSNIISIFNFQLSIRNVTVT